MTRIEKNQELDPPLKATMPTVQDIKKEENQKPKKGRGKLIGCGLFLAIFLAFILGVSWFLAASGLVTIPVISSWAYKTPAPLHEVKPGVVLEAYVSDNFNSLLTQRLQAGGGELKDRSVSLKLPENSLTASFQETLTSSNLSFFDAMHSQVAIDKDQGIELFIPLAGQTNGNAVRFLLQLTTNNGGLSIVSVKSSVGNLNMPVWFSDAVVKPLLERGLIMVNQKLSQYLSIESLEFNDSEIILLGTITVEVIKIN